MNTIRFIQTGRRGRKGFSRASNSAPTYIPVVTVASVRASHVVVQNLPFDVVVIRHDLETVDLALSHTLEGTEAFDWSLLGSSLVIEEAAKPVASEVIRTDDSTRIDVPDLMGLLKRLLAGVSLAWSYAYHWYQAEPRPERAPARVIAVPVVRLSVPHATGITLITRQNASNIHDLSGRLDVTATGTAEVTLGKPANATIHGFGKSRLTVERPTGTLEVQTEDRSRCRVNAANLMRLTVSCDGTSVCRLGGKAETASLTAMGSGRITGSLATKQLLSNPMSSRPIQLKSVTWPSEES